MNYKEQDMNCSIKISDKYRLNKDAGNADHLVDCWSRQASNTFSQNHHANDTSKYYTLASFVPLRCGNVMHYFPVLMSIMHLCNTLLPNRDVDYPFMHYFTAQSRCRLCNNVIHRPLIYVSIMHLCNTLLLRRAICGVIVQCFPALIKAWRGSCVILSRFGEGFLTFVLYIDNRIKLFADAILLYINGKYRNSNSAIYVNN